MRTSRLTLKTRVALAVAGVPIALAALLVDAPAPTAELAAEGTSARNWLAALTLGYAASYALAWFTRRSWNLALGRLLVWGVVAFLGISEIVDLVGGHQDVAWQLLGAAGPGDPETVAALRGQLACWGAVLALALISIFVGFEEPLAEAPASPD